MAGKTCESRAKAVTKKTPGATTTSRVASIVNGRAKQAGHGKGTSVASGKVMARGSKKAAGKKSGY